MLVIYCYLVCVCIYIYIYIYIYFASIFYAAVATHGHSTMPMDIYDRLQKLRISQDEGYPIIVYCPLN